MAISFFNVDQQLGNSAAVILTSSINNSFSITRATISNTDYQTYLVWLDAGNEPDKVNL